MEAAGRYKLLRTLVEDEPDHRAILKQREPQMAEWVLKSPSSLYRAASHLLSLIDMGFDVTPWEVEPRVLQAAKVVASKRQQVRAFIHEEERKAQERANKKP